MRKLAICESRNANNASSLRPRCWAVPSARRARVARAIAIRVSASTATSRSAIAARKCRRSRSTAPPTITYVWASDPAGSALLDDRRQLFDEALPDVAHEIELILSSGLRQQPFEADKHRVGATFQLVGLHHDLDSVFVDILDRQVRLLDQIAEVLVQ